MPEKLVRDRIPEIIRADGGPGEFRQASKDEMIDLLRRKLVEEAQELLTADNDSRLGELADVTEVLDELMKYLAIRRFEVLGIAECKRNERGGFAERWILITPDSPTTKEPGA